VTREVRLSDPPGVQASGQLKRREKSRYKKVNPCPAAENAGQGSTSLEIVKNRFLTKEPHSWTAGIPRPF
jgi:hypothetical protein